MRLLLTVLPVLAALFLAAPQSPAIAAQAVDCTAPGSAVDARICADASLAELDLETARLFALIHDSRFLSEQKRRDLLGEHGRWLQSRNACAAEQDAVHCIAETYMRRIHQLRRESVHARMHSAWGISLGPMAVDCRDFGGGLVATLVSGTRPRAYLEWRDGAIMLTLTPSPSGARYAAGEREGAVALWTRDETAVLSLPGKADDTCAFEEIE